jgi:plasmid stabilization system protein ParE
VKPPIFRPAAAADVEDAYRWYENQRTGLGDEFLTAVGTVVESLTAYPERFTIVYRQTRRANLQRFPYSLFYRIIDEQVIFVACMHGRRHPRRWQLRN